MGEITPLVDAIDDLTARLGSFHISTRWRVVGEAEDPIDANRTTRKAGSSDSEDDDSSSKRIPWAPGDTKTSIPVVFGLLPTALALPGLLQNEIGDLITAYEERRKRPPHQRISLPNPKSGSRPCWEPSILDYSEYEDILKAHDTITEREGRGDIVWRTEVLDLSIEHGLLEEYPKWVKAMLDEAKMESDDKESGEFRFYRALLQAVGR